MEENVEAMDAGLLWPKWEALWSWLLGGEATLPGLSAGIVALILGMTVFFATWVLVGWYKSSRQIRFLNGLLKDVTTDQLISVRRDLRQKAVGQGYVGNLWTEFDETLVASPDDNLLWNTVDADYFFNTHTLARGVTESRLIAAVPGFLTAFGVIGTFVGLQLGLAGIDFTRGLENSTAQIQNIISGASVAFMTSVWGISLSVWFNFCEKLVEQRLRKNIANLQERIDNLYPRIRPEQMLVKIEDHGRESRNAMQGLAEKIGDKMQEATLQMADRIQEGVASGLQQVLGPAIEQLVSASSDLSSRQAQSSEQVLGSLVEKFAGQMGDYANQQRGVMAQASQDVKEATTSLQSGMNAFLEKMNNQFTDLQLGQVNLLNSVKSTVSSHTDETKQVLQLGSDLAERVDKMSEGLTTIGDDLRGASAAMNQSAENLNQMGSKTQVATTHLSAVLDKAIETTEKFVASSQGLTTRISESLAFLENFDGSIKTTTDGIESVATTVQESLGQLRSTQVEFLEKQKEQIQGLAKDLQDALDNYAGQVEGQTVQRLNTWNEQTREYLESMTNAVHVINDTVNELEDKLPPSAT